ncbi:MAG: ferric siderophore ABC transporter substrate-binding protein [Chryseobacterium sp.]|nr:MAG: ferric siderophore ABC transporter substrate-binding protein [Chryseobacterium sp.]
MNIAENHQLEKRDRLKSAVLTLLLSVGLFLLIFFYKFTTTPAKINEEVTTMLINFGDNREGTETDEAANQEGSVAAETETVEPTEMQPTQPQPQPAVEERVLTGKNTTTKAPTANEIKKNTASTKTPATKKETKATPKTSNAQTASNARGDGRGMSAIGNLIKGRGNANSQGSNGNTGNSGDPVGGEGNGDSKIGVDRKLVNFIPGTMGRGGAQPAHGCSASGSITIAYTVDRAGNVISASRSGGTADPCIVSTSTDWVRRYVKAERANTTSTGTYRITF